MNSKRILELAKLPDDGRLYHNQRLDTIESLIPTPFGSNHAADLLMLPSGDLLCAWFAGTDEGNADISVVVSRLNHDSNQWTKAVVVSDDHSRSEQNPSLFLHPNNEIWLMYTAQVARELVPNEEFNLQYTSEIRRKISKDGGLTWGKTETMFAREGSFCRQKIQILSNGRFIFGNWICFNDSTRNGSDINVMQLSDDQGKTWREVEVPESHGCVHPNIVELENGLLIALYRSRAADHIYMSRSENFGESWSEPVPTELPNNNSSISAIKLLSGAVAVVYNDLRFSDDRNVIVWPYERCPVTVAVSKDGGASWPWRRHVDTGDGFCGANNLRSNHRYEYPCMMQKADGTIHVAYSFYTRICIKHVCFTEDWIYGTYQKIKGDCKLWK